jgi:signal transduction histidine kinase
MTTTSTSPGILLVDSNPDDRALAHMILERQLSDAVVTAPADPLAFAEALIEAAPDVLVVAEDLAWFKVGELIAAIRRRHPRTALVVMASRAAGGADAGSAHPGGGDRLASAGMALDGFIQKTVPGFLRLGSIVGEVLARAGHTAHPSHGTAAPQRLDDVSDTALMFSHDLKEPVQQILRLARRAAASQGAAGAGGPLQPVVEVAERLNAMLEGMVEYLGVIRSTTPASVDLNQSLNHALQTLRPAIDEAEAEIRAAPLPTIVGDERQMRHLFQNLIGNAIKFRGPERLRITITVESRDDAWLVAVADNGIGIPERALHRIFELGARLHTREEYAGSGIGLALCKRIVETHGGRIWATSDGPGSTFYVLLPGVSPNSSPVSGNLKAAQADTSKGGDDGRLRERVAD